MMGNLTADVVSNNFPTVKEFPSFIPSHPPAQPPPASHPDGCDSEGSARNGHGKTD